MSAKKCEYGPLVSHLCKEWCENLRGKLNDQDAFHYLKSEFIEKQKYCLPSFSEEDIMEIVSNTDDATIQLQEMGKRELVNEPLSFKVAPCDSIIFTVLAVLHLFRIKVPQNATNESIWSQCWGNWIILNMEQHLKGWEWTSTGEPVGLFTRPYLLSPTADKLREVKSLMSRIKKNNDEASWPSHFRAYLRLKEWLFCAYKYVHMKMHCIDSFSAYNYVEEYTRAPPKTVKQNSWFMAETVDGIKYYYNHVTNMCCADEPLDFDGHDAVPSKTVEENMKDALMCDANTRAAIESQRVKQQALIEATSNQTVYWIQCYDRLTRENYYYNFNFFKLSYTKPPRFVPAKDSLAFQSVVKIQGLYRVKQARKMAKEKRAALKALPTFASSSFY